MEDLSKRLLFHPRWEVNGNSGSQLNDLVGVDEFAENILVPEPGNAWSLAPRLRCTCLKKERRCSAPYPPSPDKTDQHVVVTFTLPDTPVTLLGMTGTCGDRTRLARAPARHHEALKERNPTYPVGGLCSLLFSPATDCIVLIRSEISD